MIPKKKNMINNYYFDKNIYKKKLKYLEEL